MSETPKIGFVATRPNLSLVQTYFNIKSERFLLQSITSLKIQFDRKEIGPLFILHGFRRIFLFLLIQSNDEVKGGRGTPYSSGFSLGLNMYYLPGKNYSRKFDKQKVHDQLL